MIEEMFSIAWCLQDKSNAYARMCVYAYACKILCVYVSFTLCVRA